MSDAKYKFDPTIAIDSIVLQEVESKLGNLGAFLMNTFVEPAAAVFIMQSVIDALDSAKEQLGLTDEEDFDNVEDTDESIEDLILI